MKERGPDPSSIPLLERYHRFRRLALLVVIVFVLAACSSPFSNDDGDDDDPSTTPAPTGVTSAVSTPTATESDQPTVETDGEWTVITAPDREPAPETRGEDEVLRMSGSADGPGTIDPAQVRDTESTFLARQVFRGLVRLNANLEPVPDLAERIEISPDGRTYRVVLHEGITFHDGTLIEAVHVKASLERATDPALEGGDGTALPSRNYLDDIDGALERMAGDRDDIPGIRVVDQRTLEFDLVRGVVDFLERLANASTYIVDVNDAAEGGDWWRSPNGSGPFRIEEWDSERVLRLVPHDGYVRPPTLSEVSIRMGREAVGEVRLYETGQIDIASVPVSVIDRFDYDGSPHQSELRREPLLSTTFVMINRTIDPFDDEQLRQALMHAFPRERIASVMFDGRVERADGVLPPAMADPSDASFPFAYDDEQARALANSLEPGGVDGSLTMFTSGGGIPVAMKEFYDEIFVFDVEVVQLRWADYMQDLQARQTPFFVLSWVADGPDPTSFLRSLFHSQSPENYLGFADEQVDELLDEALVEQDDERRNELVREAHQRVLDSAVIMPLYHGVDHMLVRDHIRGLETTPMGILGLETVWIEE